MNPMSEGVIGVVDPEFQEATEKEFPPAELRRDENSIKGSREFSDVQYCMKNILILFVVLFSFANHAICRERIPMPTSKISIHNSDDYTFMWWAHGWRGEKIRCLQTSSYGMAMDVERVAITHFGRLPDPLPYERAVSQSNDVVFDLPPAALELSIAVDGREYACTGGGHPRLIESGRFLQRADIQDLVFADSAGQILPVEGRLEIIAWPDRLAILLEIAPDENRETCRAVIRFTADGEVVEQASTVSHWAAGETQALHAVLFQRAPENEPVETSVQAFEQNGENPLPVTYDDARGWHLIDLPANPVKQSDKAHLDRIRLNLENSGDSPKAIRLNFAQHDKVPTITGIVPLLRDSLGNPTGIPVQISKNWHQTKGKTFLYQGPWLHALTAVELPPQSQIELEFCLARDFWGELPLASHAQLCLIGWGVDQLWDQAAIGSWGESICYDPDVCLNRSVIDDVRPLMVTQMKTPDGKWGWTNNVGGGDFLVYFDRDGDKQYLTRMRSAYLSQGPNLTDVVYSGVSADGKIAATMRVMTPRCDDLNRAYHYFRYDVLKPVEFSRLAFYQVGADNYNDHQFGKLARGDETGLLEEWVAQQGGLEYHRRGIPCPGNAPWFSLHEGVSKDEKGGAWANRGLVIRSWKARLGGKEAPPTAASYGTQNRPHSCNIELTPPPDVTQLQPGDFVEAWVEFLVLPQSADDYYGPNESLRGDLQSNGNTWKPVFRQAAGNALQIETENGTLLRAYPPRIEVGQNREAEIAIAGGIGYLPLTFSGLSDQRGWQLLYRNTDGEWITIDQSAFGNDFWQIGREGNGKYAVTFNVSLDARDGVTREKRFRLVRGPQGDQ